MMTPDQEIPLAHSPAGAAKRASLTTRKIYDLIAQGELRSFRLGKRRLIPESELQRLIERKLKEAA